MKPIMLCMLLVSCATTLPLVETPRPAGPNPMAEWKGQIFVGDHMRQAAVRAQSNDLIPANDPRFSNMICIPYPDFTDLVSRIQYLREAQP